VFLLGDSVLWSIHEPNSLLLLGDGVLWSITSWAQSLLLHQFLVGNIILYIFGAANGQLWLRLVPQLDSVVCTTVDLVGIWSKHLCVQWVFSSRITVQLTLRMYNLKLSFNTPYMVTGLFNPRLVSWHPLEVMWHVASVHCYAHYEPSLIYRINVYLKLWRSAVSIWSSPYDMRQVHQA
jgi:hypothetical protein